MTNQYRDLIKFLSQQIVRYGILPNRKRIAANATEKVQSKMSSAQNIITKKYNTVAKKLNDQFIIVQNLRDKALVPGPPLPKQIVKWWQWYNQLTGLHTVEEARRQVITLQDKLFKCQDKRRISSKELTNITEKLNNIMVELVQTKRDDNKYVHLTKMEHEHVLQQKKIFNHLSLSEKEEKDIFTQLATVTKEYHDSQNLHSQKYKYLSILAWALMTIVSLISSIVLKNQTLVDIQNDTNTIKKSQEKDKNLFLQAIQANGEQLSDLKKTMNNNEQLSDLKKTMNSMFSQLSQKIKDNGIENDKGNEKITSNILMTSAKYSINVLISGSSYVYKGIYACGSYLAKPFLK